MGHHQGNKGFSKGLPGHHQVIYGCDEGVHLCYLSSDPPPCQILLVTEKEVKEKLKELKVASYTDVLVWAGGQPQHQQQKQASASNACVAVEQARENLSPPVAAPDTQSSFVGE